jgi:hypothetical protein
MDASRQPGDLPGRMGLSHTIWYLESTDTTPWGVSAPGCQWVSMDKYDGDA